MSTSVDITIEGIGLKVAPPAVVSGAVMMGMTAPEWVTIFTLLYLVLAIGLLIPKYITQIKIWYRQWKGRKNGD